MKPMPINYLGDGLYVKCDGYQVYLMANSHTNPTDIVALDVPVLGAFLRWVEMMKKENEGDEE